MSQRESCTEVRVPADRRYAVVVKRAAAGFAAVAGLDIESLDELVIAVSQAFESAITAAERTLGPGVGQIRFSFDLSGPAVDIQVRSFCSRAELEAAHRRATAQKLAAQQREAHELALQLMGLFVDDCRYTVDERTGGFRVRLTKYRVS